MIHSTGTDNWRVFSIYVVRIYVENANTFQHYQSALGQIKIQTCAILTSTLRCSIRNPIYRTSWNRNADTNVDKNLCRRITMTFGSSLLLCYCSHYAAGIATRYGLHRPEFEIRWGELGQDIPYPSRRPQDPSSLCTMGTRSHSRGLPNHMCLKTKNPIF
jgi:hypothetical protein